MTETPEERARQTIDRLLTEAGWAVQSRDEANVLAGRGVAIREFPLKSGYGFADYLLYVDGSPAGVVEAKKEGETLTGFEIQSEKYSVGLPEELRPHRKPLPFCYQIKRDKANLDVFWLRDESLEDSANLPDPEVIAAEIAEDLQAALDQFSRITGDLKT